MHAGSEHSMGAPSGFAARRPNASSLPNFELPPPPISTAQKYHYSTTQAGSIQGHPASVGNLLTPPSNLSGDGLSPTGTTSTASNSAQHGQQHQYTSHGYVWSPHHQNPSYNFQTGAQQPYSQQRSSGIPPPSSYELNLPSFSSSGPMSASTLATMPSQQHHMSMGASTPVSSAPHHPSPVHAQDGFRAPPTPGYYSTGSGSTPHNGQFSYATNGPSPTQQSPMSAGSAMPRMSPSTGGPVSSLSATSQSPHAYQRPFGQYPLPGPVLSNVQNPSGQMQLVNGSLTPGMPLGFNSGHAASLHAVGLHGTHLYHGAPPSHHPGSAAAAAAAAAHAQAQGQSSPPNDRPFKCDQCPQSFNRNHDLKRHKRIHLAVKPFPCGHCDKSFSRKDALKRHILVKGCGKPVAPGADSKAKGEVGGDSSSSSVSPRDSGHHHLQQHPHPIVGRPDGLVDVGGPGLGVAIAPH